MKELYSQIAQGFVVIVDGLVNDLAEILEKESDATRRALMAGRDRRTEEWLDKRLSR